MSSHLGFKEKVSALGKMERNQVNIRVFVVDL